jgi:protein SCO1/2
MAVAMNGSRLLGFARTCALCAAALLLASACTGRPEKPQFRTTDVAGVGWGTDFQLFDVHGNPRRLADYRGKVVMLFMGYTNCPDVCPTTLAKMARAVSQLGNDGASVQGIFITLDPARDTPEVLWRYIRAFDPRFVALRGDASATARTAKEFKAYYEAHEPDSHGSYAVDHLGGIFVFDKLGRLRLFVGPELPVDAIVHDLRVLLDE